MQCGDKNDNRKKQYITYGMIWPPGWSYCFKAIKPKEIITGNDSDPCAKRINLGWGNVGKVRGVDSKEVVVVTVYRTIIQEVMINHEKMPSHSAYKSQVGKLFELDFNEVNVDRPISQYDEYL